MKLSGYMKLHHISPDDMATRIDGVSASAVRKWMYGERMPRPEQMRRIAEITERQVMPNDFILELSEAAE